MNAAERKRLDRIPAAEVDKVIDELRIKAAGLQGEAASIQSKAAHLLHRAAYLERKYDKT